MNGIRVVVAVTLSCASAPVGGQSIRGVVIEPPSRTPVAQAEIVLQDGAGRLVARGATDTLGAFVVRTPADGSYVLHVSHVAYAPYVSAPVPVGPGETVTLEVRLGRTAIPLDPLIVTARSSSRLADFHRRRAVHAFGRFITREEIDRHSPPNTSDLLRGIPGVVIVPVRARGGRTVNLVAMRNTLGRCGPAVYVDGLLLLPQQAQSTIDDVLTPAMLEGVEIYGTVGGAPAQFRDPGGCGVILFWTRSGDPDGGRRFGWVRAAIGLGAAVVFILLVR